MLRIIVKSCTFATVMRRDTLYIYNKMLVLLSCVLFSVGLLAQPRWAEVDSLAEDAVRRGVVPGAVVCVVRGDSVEYLRAFGNRQVYPLTLPMTTTTIFDLASLSKTVGTAMAVMTLVEQHRLSVDDMVSDYIPQFSDSVTIAHLLTHTSGLPSYLNVKRMEAAYGSPAPDSLLSEICAASKKRRDEHFRYSCLNFIALQHIVERVTGEPLDVYYRHAVALPLGMSHTAYCPPQEWLPQVAPTENIRVGRYSRRLLHGEVHDPLARVMNGGVSGNAGLFSTAADLARLCMFLLNPTSSAAVVAGYTAPLSAATVERMTTVPVGFEDSGRTLGWDSHSDYNAPVGQLLSDKAYCHSGYTGTSIAIDPKRKVAIIILTNRVHPVDKGSVNPLRRQIANAVAKIYPLADIPDVSELQFYCPLPDSVPPEHHPRQLFGKRRRRLLRN